MKTNKYRKPFPPFIKKKVGPFTALWFFVLYRWNYATKKLDRLWFRDYQSARRNLEWHKNTSIEDQKEYFEDMHDLHVIEFIP